MRVLASPDYLRRHGTPRDPGQLAQHALLGFTQPEALNDWPLRDASGASVHACWPPCRSCRTSRA